jgi:hypothetical protein
LLDEYFKWRERLGEIISQRSPVIRKEFNTEMYRAITMAQPITAYSISWQINHLLDDSGTRARADGRRSELMQCHGFRKFFKTISINGGMNPVYSEHLMGHRTGLTEVYFKPTDTELLEGNDKAIGYTGVINDLTINEEFRLKGKVEELIQKKKEIELMESKHNEEIKAIREDMENRFQQIFTKIDVTKVQ